MNEPVTRVKLYFPFFRQNDGRPRLVLRRELPLELSIRTLAAVTSRTLGTCYTEWSRTKDISKLSLRSTNKAFDKKILG